MNEVEEELVAIIESHPDGLPDATIRRRLGKAGVKVARKLWKDGVLSRWGTNGAFTYERAPADRDWLRAPEVGESGGIGRNIEAPATLFQS